MENPMVFPLNLCLPFTGRKNGDKMFTKRQGGVLQQGKVEIRPRLGLMEEIR